MRVSEYILSKIEAYGSNTAQIDAKTLRRITFDEVRKKSKALAKWLRAQGLGRGNTVGLMSANNVDFVWICLGIMEGGAACHFIDPRYTLREVLHALDTAPVDALVLQKGTFNPLADLVTAKINLVLEFDDETMYCSTGARHTSFTEVTICSVPDVLDLDNRSRNQCQKGGKLDLEGAAGGSCEFTSSPDDIAFILRSSGTTGLPKGVIHTHGTALAGVELRNRLPGEGGTSLNSIPFHFAYGLATAFSFLCEGATLVILPRFSLSTWIETIKKFSISRLPLVPSLVATLLKSDSIDFGDFTSVTHLYLSSAPISDDNLKSLQKRFLQPLSIQKLYGLSECFHHVCAYEMNRDKPGSMGRISESIQAKIIDVESKEFLEPNSVGEICIKGPMVTPGYINNPESTAEAFIADGWFRTGDLGYFDDDGFFYFVERAKIIIKYQGHQVSPSELEFVLMSHPHIQEAAVVGIDHEIFGQVPRAFVILREKSDITAQEIHNYMRGELAPYKLLRGGLVFVSSIPKTSSGKIQRHSLHGLPVGNAHYDDKIKEISFKKLQRRLQYGSQNFVDECRVEKKV